MNRWLRRGIYLFMGILLSIVVLFSVVEWIAFDMDYYMEQFERNNVPEVTGMDPDQLRYTMEDMFEYLRGDDRHRLETEAYFGDELRPVYGEREILHMVDVRDLFVGGRRLRNVGIILLLVLAFVMVKKDDRWKKGFTGLFAYTMVGNLLFFGLLALLMYIDFTKYFTIFHLIFFDNDLWILNPRTDTLIQMVPEPFFYHTAYKITMYYSAVIGGLGLLGWGIKLRMKKGW